MRAAVLAQLRPALQRYRPAELVLRGFVAGECLKPVLGGGGSGGLSSWLSHAMTSTKKG